MRPDSLGSRFQARRYAVQTHYHTGPVFAVTYSGSWYYKEYPAFVNRAGSYLYEPAHSIHTLMVSDDIDEDTVVWFAIYGCNVNVDEGGNILGIVDAKAVLQVYQEGCQARGNQFIGADPQAGGPAL